MALNPRHLDSSTAAVREMHAFDTAQASDSVLRDSHSDVQQPSREQLRADHLAATPTLLPTLVSAAKLDATARRRIHDHALLLAATARRSARHEGFALGLVHRFGLNTPQGIALMQLAEALPRTTDAVSAHALIADKIGPLSWRDAIGESPRWVERLALHALDTLSKTFREPRPDSRMQRFARRSLEKAIAALSSQYVLGETLPSAIRNGRRWARLGYRYSYDMLGEAAMTDAAARAFHQSYMAAVETLAARKATGSQAISVKLSALHPRFEERQRERSLPILIERIKQIALRAKAADLQLTIDAEESDRLELTLDVFEALCADSELAGWNGLGLAVQAYQRRGYALLHYLNELAYRHHRRIPIRLVKGAYWDTEIKRAQQLGLSDYPIFLRKSDTDVSYLACARFLLERADSFYPQFATHNAHTTAAIVEIAQQCGNTQFEFQRLHGMGEHLHNALLREGHQSRIYAPIGPRRDLLPYLVRRLLENGASSSFVRQLSDLTIPIDQLIRDPMSAAPDETNSENYVRTNIASPLDIRHQNWSAAKGFDLSVRDTRAALLTYLAMSTDEVIAGPLINGALSSREARPVVSPIDRTRMVGRVIDATEEDVAEALVCARAIQPQWASVPPRSRAAFLERAAELLEQRAPQFIRLAVIEAGKTLDDAIGEVREAADFCRYYAEQCRLPVMQARAPLGVVACISPWNFPLAIFLGQVAGALAAGNCVIAKPAEQTPLIALLATRLLFDAGIPVGALQLLTGDGRIGAAITSSAIDGVCFTGSFETAKHIDRSVVKSGRGALPFIAETGGINAMLVDSSALPEQVVRDAIASAFQSAGQRCSALRVLCVQNEIADTIIEMLRGALAELEIGDPQLLQTDVGPVIDADAYGSIGSYLEGRQSIAQCKPDSKTGTNGWFIAPTLIEVQRIGDIEREVFGPVLHVMRFDGAQLMTVVQDINALGYGLTLGVHSRIRKRVQALVEAARIGNIYVNRNQIGAMVGQQPFGGHALSGTGPKAGGPHYLLRLSRVPHAPQLVTADSLVLMKQSLDAKARSIASLTHAAQEQWRRTARRNELVQFACQLLLANTANRLSVVADKLRIADAAVTRISLPAIAGEENILYLRPRGVLLCVTGRDQTLEVLAAQALLSIATGNGALVVVYPSNEQAFHELLALLQQCGIPEHLVGCLEVNTALPESWLSELAIDGVVFDGADLDKQRVVEILSARSGPIMPVLSCTDDLYRFYLEQTVTTNTAAAGGDPHLLAN